MYEFDVFILFENPWNLMLECGKLVYQLWNAWTEEAV